MIDYGYTPNPAATEAYCATLPRIYGEQLVGLAEADDGRDALNYRALTTCLQRAGLTHWLRDRDGVPCIRSLNQGRVGSCVGNAQARMLDVLAAVEICSGDREEFRATFSPDALYGLGREKAGMLRSGRDGCYGSAIAAAVREWGTIHQLVYPVSHASGGSIDLRSYDETRCRQYGYYGVPAELKTIAAEHQVGHTARVTTAEEGWAALGHGYCINMCSNLGWDSTRDADGVIRRRGSWGHSMAVTSRRTTRAGTRLVLVHQSWITISPDDWTTGPYYEDQPWGSFWITLADFGMAVAQGDTFVHSSYEGFVPRQLPDFGTKEIFG